MRTTESGFIALMSVIIISALMMAVSFALSMSGFLARANVTDSEYKERSMALADGCADDALVKLAANSAYAGNETPVDIACTILPITTVGSQRIIKTTASVQGATTNIQVTATLDPLTVISWQELP
jgi:hypothetical protein